jgi:hypothetical protein
MFAFKKWNAVIGILVLSVRSALGAGCNPICNNCFHESGRKPICLYRVEPEKSLDLNLGIDTVAPLGRTTELPQDNVTPKLTGKSLFFYNVTPEVEAKIKAAIGQ